jgi:hypothetical protein
MLRADNITCITVMLDPPGPPFSECILNKKKQTSLSTCKFILFFFFHLFCQILASDAIEIDQLCETPQRPKLAVQRKEQILSPISNGLTPTRVRIDRLTFSS